MDEMNRFLNQTSHFSESQQQRKKPQFHLDLSKVVSTEQLIQDGKAKQYGNWKSKYLSQDSSGTGVVAAPPKYDYAEVLRRSQAKRKSRPPSEKPGRVAFTEIQPRSDFNFKQLIGER